MIKTSVGLQTHRYDRRNAFVALRNRYDDRSGAFAGLQNGC